MTTVLIAEDDEGVRVLLRTALERQGYAVLVAEDGRAAMDILDRQADSISAVISDVHMPGAGGLEVLARARELRPGMALILASGTDRWELSPDQVAGDITLLEKPYGLDQLGEAIETALRARADG